MIKYSPRRNDYRTTSQSNSILVVTPKDSVEGTELIRNCMEDGKRRKLNVLHFFSSRVNGNAMYVMQCSECYASAY